MWRKPASCSIAASTLWLLVISGSVITYSILAVFRAVRMLAAVMVSGSFATAGDSEEAGSASVGMRDRQDGETKSRRKARRLWFNGFCSDTNCANEFYTFA